MLIEVKGRNSPKAAQVRSRVACEGRRRRRSATRISVRHQDRQGGECSETPAQGDGVLVEIKIAEGATVTSGVVLGVIDTEAKAGPPRRRPAPAAAAPAPHRHRRLQPAAPADGDCSRSARRTASREKMMAEAGIDAASVQGHGPWRSHHQGRRDCRSGGKVGAWSGLASAPKAAPVSAPPVNVPLGNRPEQRVRDDACARASPSAWCNPIHCRHSDHVQRGQHEAGDRSAQRLKDKFEKVHGVKLGFMSFFVRPLCTR